MASILQRLDRRITNSPQWTMLAFVALVALIRGGVLYAKYDDLKVDHDAYNAIAEGISTTGTFGSLIESTALDGTKQFKVTPSAYRPPLYPWLLSWLTKHDSSAASKEFPLGISRVSTFAVAVLHWLLGLATCYLAYQVAKALSSRESLGLLAAILVAVDPILLRQSTLVMTETLATFLAVAVIAWWTRSIFETTSVSFPNCVYGGALFGLSILCRPTAMVWLVLLGCTLTFCVNRSTSRFKLLHVLMLGFGALFVVSPWLVRNAIMFGQAKWSTTHGGYTLLLANNPVFYDQIENAGIAVQFNEQAFHDWWLEKRKEVNATESMNASNYELAEDRFASQLAMETIMKEPITFLKASIKRLVSLFGLVPNANQASFIERTVIGIWYGAVFMFAAMGSIRTFVVDRKRLLTPMIPALLLILSLAMVHAVYWSNMRMRAVAMPAIYVLAICGCGCRCAKPFDAAIETFPTTVK
jgi:4-amino-4-deoxy-L-arabinose transferase-like glycosyltransferase